MGKGLQHDPLADIELIRQNLKDRYRAGLPVLKELVQNADDAGAELVDFVWTPGIKAASHPLLQGPGLVALNDGRFNDADREAIRLMGLSDKPRERESIGKFGLGLKSVFHWCEAFIYLASSGKVTEVEGDILNPWSGESTTRSFHSEWDDFTTEDNFAITKHLGSILPFSRWFCLWVPLRRRAYCGSLAPIQHDFPGDREAAPDFLTESSLDRRLAETLSLLANVQQIRVWLLSEDGRPQKSATIELLRGAHRRQYRRKGSLNVGSHRLSGQIKLSSQNVHLLRGQERLIDDTYLNGLKNSDFWPSAMRIDRDTAAEEKVPEKADPHAAAVFLAHPKTRNGELAVVWATFLPLGEPVFPKDYRDLSEYTLLLHGDFFVDPGRNRPDFGDHEVEQSIESESDLRRSWNRRLAQVAVIPSVLPALEAIAEMDLNRDAISNLSQAVVNAFESSPDLIPWRSDLCREHQWAFCLDEKGGSWRLLPAQEQLIGVPAPPQTDPSRPSTIFPSLSGITQRMSVTLAEWPRIAPSKELADWPEDALLEMLNIDVPHVFASSALLEYLVDFLSTAGESRNARNVQQNLTAIGRAALLNVDFAALRQHRQVLGRFLGLISPDLLCPLAVGDTAEAQTLFRSLVDLPLDVLPVPSEFIREHAVPALQARKEDAVAMLQALAGAGIELPENERANALSALAIELLRRCGDARREVLEQCKELRLFRAFDCKQGRAVSVSWKQLVDSRMMNCLFVRPESLVKVLQEALDQRKVLLIDKPIATVLFDEDELDPCEAREASLAVLSAPSLSAIEHRSPLLRELLSAAATNHAENILLAIRYLLHGDGQHVRDKDSLLSKGLGEEPDVWAKLTEQALSLLNAQWRLVPSQLSALVPPIQRQGLLLEDIQARTVADLVKKAKPEKIRCEELTQSDRDLVIRDIDDLDLLPRLAIHPDLSGRLHAIGPRKFLKSDFPVDEVFDGLVTILRPSQSPGTLDKQRRFIDPWTERTAMRLALDQDETSRFAQQILNAIRSRGGVGELASDLRTALRGKPWLPDGNGSGFAPDYVLHIKEMDDEIALLVGASEGVFVDVGMIDPTVKNHQAFRFVAEDLMPDSKSVLGTLGALVKDCQTLEAYRIGQITLSVAELDAFLGTFQGVPPGLMSSLSLIRKSAKLVGDALCVEQLVPGLATSIPADRLSQILDYVVEKYHGLSHAEQSACLTVYDLYLRAVVDQQAREAVPKLRLLNAKGKWRPIGELCSPTATGIDGSNVVDQAQFDIIHGLLPAVAGSTLGVGSGPSPLPALQGSLDQSAEVLKSYFRPWEDHCPRPVIAGLLSMLGDGPMRDLAENFFDNRGNVDSMRSRLEWKPVRGVTNLNGWGAADSPLEVMRMQRIVVSVHSPNPEDSVRMRNLLGQLIPVPLSQDFEHLLLGERIPHNPVNSPMDQLRSVAITLRPVQVQNHTEQELSQLLRETARRILSHVYMQDVANLDHVWAGLHEGEQKDIRIAQSRLAESILNNMRYHGLSGHSVLADLFHRWDQAQGQKVELEDLAGRDADRLREKAEISAREVREELKQLLSENSQIQSVFLSKVQERIGRQYQYRPDSIPFELFQNADDAVVELQEMLHETSLPTSRRQFDLIWEPSSLSVLHWGRPINYFRRGEFDGRQRGFDADLEKMLILAASDKGFNTELPKVTGRFGLGFKSVFLFADRADIISDLLAFTVVGGLFPKVMINNHREQLRQQFGPLGFGQDEATLIHLPSANEHDTDIAVARFCKLVHVLLVFSRAIKTCNLIDQTGERTSVTWQEQALPGLDGIMLGQLTPVHDLSSEASRAVLFKSATGAVLLRLGPREFVPFGEDIPTIWVTAPIGSTEGLGFAINAPFHPDVGRAQLASQSDHNLRLAERLGSELGVSLRSLANLARADWQSLLSNLGLAANTTQYFFWKSLWDLFATSLRSRGDETEELRVVKHLLWGQPEVGMASLVSRHDVIPSGLSDNYQTLTSLQRVSHQTIGCLDQHPEIFAGASKWASFCEKVPPSSIVASKIATTLTDLAPSTVRFKPLGLLEVLAWEVGESRRVDSAMTAHLGAVVTENLIDGLRLGKIEERAEHEELQKFLGQLQFKARNGAYCQPADLVADSNKTDPDEILRVGFAPANRVLASQYVDSGLSFFLLCRGREQPGSQDLARWILEAADHEARTAAIRYLAQGRLNSEVASHLRGRLAGTWLANIQSLGAMSTLTSWEQNLVLSLLNQLPPPTPQAPPTTPLDAKRVLEKTYEWWQEDGQALMKSYLAQVYPKGGPPALTTDWQALRNDPVSRRNWLQLLLLGATFTLGGVQREQHRAFIEWCDERGWFDAFAKPNQDPTVIINCLKDYLEHGLDHLEFYYWMRLFVPLFQLATWLDEYTWIFVQLENLAHPVNLYQVLAPNANPHLSGTGIGAPPLGRTLGFGACFVLREMTRLNVISNNAIHPFCYVPSRPARRILRQLGCHGMDDARPQPEMSKAIHSFLCENLGGERAQFGKCFDIPLLLLAERPDLQEEVFGRTVCEPETQDVNEVLP